ncbi:hypothetical protein L2E82_31982 [Cichorium intybus]|uniref:Uncharacterized protein n=1 Tax=Cichorium intybus TaxID=13427 RepID=A0ACB9BES1_CICIN|nr:hypothetical protein L2E82_31982 [Cichorium intybus]
MGTYSYSWLFSVVLIKMLYIDFLISAEMLQSYLIHNHVIQIHILFVLIPIQFIMTSDMCKTRTVNEAKQTSRAILPNEDK